jgi:ABC-2 type transport system ATP-binding protein
LTDAAISLVDLGKVYDGRWVVDGLSFDVGRGEVFALLGPNGAGKTTTVEILEGYRAPDRGSSNVLGLDPRRDRTNLMHRTGLMLQQGGVYPAIRVREVLRLFARFYPNPIDPEQLIGDMGLEEVANTRYRLLSGGQQQRLSLALALIGRPELVFLDEPTAGMDPQARRATWDIVRSLKARGVTVLLTTHFMDEAEELADRVAIVDRGHLVALDSPAALRLAGPSSRVVAGIRGVGSSLFASIPSAKSAAEERPGRWVIETDDVSEFLVELTTRMKDLGVVPDEILIGGETLEDVFLRLTDQDRSI